MSPSALTHEPLAAVVVTVIVMIMATAVGLLAVVGMEMLVYMVNPLPRQMLYRHVVERLRAAHAK